MGASGVSIEVGDPDRERLEAVEALVDTGATNTQLPAYLLRRLGVRPYRTMLFELADGSTVELEVGRTWVRLDGQEELTQVVFAEEGSPPPRPP